MMILEQEFGFLLASTICILSPGPDNLSVLSLSVSQGRKSGIGFAVGCSLGCLVHTFWAVAGISALLASSELAFRLLQFAGAAYLFYLGIRILQASPVQQAAKENPVQTDSWTDSSEASQNTFRLYLLRGLGANVLNPKVALFFLAFLPQFVGQTGNTGREIAKLGLMFSCLSLLIFCLLGYFAGSLGEWVQKKSGLNLWFNRLTAGVFFVLAVNLLFFSRWS